MTRRTLALIALLALVGCSTARAEPTPTTTTPPSTISTTTTEPTTTTTTTPPPTTTPPEPRTTNPEQETPAVQGYVGCWTDLARSIGWPEDQLPKLSRTIYRESRCDPTTFADRPSTMDNSRGLLQINAYGSLREGLRQLCGIDDLDTLFDPAVNLTCGLAYWHAMGWSPWRGGA